MPAVSGLWCIALAWHAVSAMLAVTDTIGMPVQVVNRLPSQLFSETMSLLAMQAPQEYATQHQAVWLGATPHISKQSNSPAVSHLAVYPIALMSAY